MDNVHGSTSRVMASVGCITYAVVQGEHGVLNAAPGPFRFSRGFSLFRDDLIGRDMTRPGKGNACGRVPPWQATL
jgi:hypothetical protein